MGQVTLGVGATGRVCWNDTNPQTARCWGKCQARISYMVTIATCVTHSVIYTGATVRRRRLQREFLKLFPKFRFPRGLGGLKRISGNHHTTLCFVDSGCMSKR